MAILSNVNGKFAVDPTGAIQFSGQTGTSGYVLKSNGNAAPTWVDGSTVIGGPYLPLAGGTLTGATATASGISLTVGGTLTVNDNISTSADKRVSVGAWDNSAFTGGNAQGFSVQGVTPGLFILETDQTNKKSYLAMSGGAMYLGGSINFLALDTDGARALTLDSSQNATFAGTILAGGGGAYNYLNPVITASDSSTNAPKSIVVNNQFNGSSAESKFIVATYGNSWHIGMGSNTHTYGNDLTFTTDATTSNSPKLRIATNGNATFAGNVSISGTLTIGGNSAITRSGSIAQGRLAIWQNDTAIKGNNNLFYASQYLTVGVGTAGGFAAIRINSATAAQSYLDFTEGASFTKRAQIQVDTNDNMYFRNTSSNSLRMTLLSDGNFGIGDSSPASKLVVAGRVQANSGSEPWAFVANPTSGNYGGFLMQYGNNTKGVCYYNSNSIIVGSEGAAIPLRFTTNGNYVAHFSGTTGNFHVGGITDQASKLHVTGGTTLAGPSNTSSGSFNVYGDRKYPQATYFVKRNYKLTAGSSSALYSLVRQWHDHANWGLGNINVIMWGVYYSHGNFSKADFSCRYGYSGGSASVQANFNPGSLVVPSWTAATQASGNIHYRDLQIQIPAYQQISFEIISPGCVQTYDVNNTAGNTVYLWPH